MNAAGIFSWRMNVPTGGLVVLECTTQAGRNFPVSFTLRANFRGTTGIH